MKDEEVDRMFRVVSDPFREKWEVQRNSCQSLLDLRKTREIAIAQEKAYREKRSFWFYAIMIEAVLSILPLWWPSLSINNHVIFYLLFVLIVMIPTTIMFARTEKNWYKQKDKVARCDGIFEKFAKSLTALNPLGTGNSYLDIIDEKYVEDKTLTLAIRVVDAQTAFDALRKNPEASRSAVIRGGEWVEKCEFVFEAFENNLAVDFGLKLLDKSRVFRDAQEYLAKTRPKTQSRF